MSICSSWEIGGHAFLADPPGQFLVKPHTGTLKRMFHILVLVPGLDGIAAAIPFQDIRRALDDARLKGEQRIDDFEGRSGNESLLAAVTVQRDAEISFDLAYDEGTGDAVLFEDGVRLARTGSGERKKEQQGEQQVAHDETSGMKLRCEYG